MLFKTKKLALSGIIALAISIVLILFSKIAINDLAFKMLVNADFGSVQALNNFTFFMASLGYFLMIVGAGLFLYIGWTSRFRVDKQQVKRSGKAFFTIVLCVLFASSIVLTQAVNANSMATTNYYLATPYSPYDWLVGKFDSGLVYAINGSCWANMMTWPSSAPWSGLAGNGSAVVEATLAATTAGSIYLKEVTFDYDSYDFMIPNDVQVIENVNGLTRVFVNSAESTGSPYTISVDTVNPAYYLCQDSMGRFLDTWTSTDAGVLFNTMTTTVTGASHFHFSKGTFVLTTVPFQLLANNGSTISGEGDSTWIDSSSFANNTFLAVSQQGLTFKNMRITGNGVSTVIHGIDLRSCSNSTVENVFIEHYGDGVKLSGTGYQNKVTLSRFGNISDAGIELEGPQYETTISNNVFQECNKGVLFQPDPSLGSGCDNLVSQNMMQDCYNGVKIESAEQNITITGNTINGKDIANNYGITLFNGTNGIAISLNTISSYISGIIIHPNSGNNVHDISITENTLSNNDENGIYAINGTRLKICNNWVYNNGKTGIYLSGCYNGSISQNTCYDNGFVTAETYYGIDLASSTDFFVTNNHCFDSQTPAVIQRVGIRLTGTSNNNYVMDNDVRGNTWVGIATVSGNYFLNNIGYSTPAESNPNNLVRGLTPTASTFDVSPSDLAKITDGDPTTKTGEGNKTLSGAGNIGYLTFPDLGASYNVMIIGSGTVWSNTSTVVIQPQVSTDNTNWYNCNPQMTAKTYTSETKYDFSGCGYARYVRLQVYGGAAQIGSCTIGEVMVLNLG